MSRKVYLCILVISCLLMFFKVSIAQELSVNNLNKVDINSMKPVVLDLLDAEVSVVGWNENHVEIKIEDLRKAVIGQHDIFDKSKNPIKVSYQNNAFKLHEAEPIRILHFKIQPWMPLVQFPEFRESVLNRNINFSTRIKFEVRVPQNVPLVINADKIFATNCTLQEVNAKNTVIQMCSTVKGFNALSKDIKADDTAFGENSVLKSRIIKVSNSTAESMELYSCEKDGSLNVEMTSVKAKSIKLAEGKYKDLVMKIDGTTIDSLVADADESNGTIILENSKIKDIKNSIGIKIVKK